MNKIVELLLDFLLENKDMNKFLFLKIKKIWFIDILND